MGVVKAVLAAANVFAFSPAYLTHESTQLRGSTGQ